MDWHEQCKDKLVSADQAAGTVKSGDNVEFAAGRECQAVGLALAARRNDLRGVKVFVPSPALDFGWYDPGWEESFTVTVRFLPTDMARNVVRERRADWQFGGNMGGLADSLEKHKIDVYLVEVSPPDENGFLSFGASRWDKKERLTSAKIAIGEVNPRLIRTYGDNYVHVSEVDYLVENPEPTYHRPSMVGEQPPAIASTIGEFIAPIVNDGDTLQIGTGGITEWLPRIGMLDKKNDLGLHTEMVPRGLVKLVRDGVINGKRKNFHPGKVIATAGGGAWEDMKFMHLNPAFELHSVFYVLNPRVMAQNDNMLAINQALAIDFSGQVTAQSIGPQIWTGEGGQPYVVMGALMSKGGRSITVIPSAARNGTVSRIVPQLEAGTIVTIPAFQTDFVVSEYGVANLRGKTRRQRAEELIAIAHPDFRAELQRQARKLFWP